MKRLNKLKGMYALLIAVAAMIGVTIYGSCSADEDIWGFDEETISNKNTRADMDYDFLDIECSDINCLTIKDFAIIGEARNRLTVSCNHGVYAIKEKAGSEVNISEKLFNLIKTGYMNNNKLLQEKNRSNIPRQKTSNIEGGHICPYTDCLGHSIASYYSLNLNWVNNVLASHFSNYNTSGVPLEQAVSAVNLFCPASGQLKFVISDNMMPCEIKGILVIPQGNNSYHAYNADYIQKILVGDANYPGYTVIGRDYQSQGILVFADVTTNFLPAFNKSGKEEFRLYIK